VRKQRQCVRVSGRVGDSVQKQGQRRLPRTAVRYRAAVTVTSGSFRKLHSRWAADVKGKPVKPVRGTLDTGCTTGSSEGMNDQEVTMSNALKSTNLIAHEKALEAAGIAITLVMRTPAPLKSIADQVIRSASSVPANLAEGHGRSGRDRMHFWRIAYASAKEVDSHLRLLAQAGAVGSTHVGKVLMTFDEVRAMTWRLINPICD
jgi:four helix bundle protein